MRQLLSERESQSAMIICRVCTRRFFQFPVMFTNNKKWRSTSWLTMFNSLFSFPTFLLFSPFRLVRSNTWVQWKHLTPEFSIDLLCLQTFPKPLLLLVPKVTTCSLYPECIVNLKLSIDVFYRESRSGVNIAKRNITTGLFALIKFVFFVMIWNPRWPPPQVIVLTQDHMGKYRNVFFSEAIALIEPKLCINHWKVLYKLCVFYVDRNSKMTTTAGHSFCIGPIGSFYYQVNDTGSWEPLVLLLFVSYELEIFVMICQTWFFELALTSIERKFCNYSQTCRNGHLYIMVTCS